MGRITHKPIQGSFASNLIRSAKKAQELRRQTTDPKKIRRLTTSAKKFAKAAGLELRGVEGTNVYKDAFHEFERRFNQEPINAVQLYHGLEFSRSKVIVAELWRINTRYKDDFERVGQINDTLIRLGMRPLKV